MSFTIQQGDLRTAIDLMAHIPEMNDGLRPLEDYERRIEGLPHVIFIARVKDQSVGFKVGYQRKDYFYSWLGGVLPEFRRTGMAKALADAQEDWARTQRYDSVTFKTRNRHKAMLAFALNNGFFITAVEEKPDPLENRIWLKKNL
jgi:predicted GNAT superfamily acetyltransferase